MAPSPARPGGNTFFTDASATTPTTLISVNHPEIRGVFVTQNDRFPQFVGYVQPANRPSWLDANLTYLLAATDSSFFSYRTFAGEASPDNSQQPDTDHYLVYPGMPFPRATQTIASVGGSTCHRGMGTTGDAFVRGDSNLIAGKRDIVPAPHILYCSGDKTKGASMYGSFSGDIAVTTADNLRFGDEVVVTPGVEEYMVISTDAWRNTASPNTINNRYAQVPDASYYPHVVLMRTL
jgi:hypothetical protein